MLSDKAYDLMSKDPISLKLMPYKITFSRSPILYLWISIFFLILSKESLSIVDIANSATAELCFKDIKSSFLFDSSESLTKWS